MAPSAIAEIDNAALVIDPDGNAILDELVADDVARSDDPHQLTFQIENGSRCMIVTLMGYGNVWRQKYCESCCGQDDGAL
jgi:hypothetical protein